MRELTMNEVREVGGNGDIADAIAVWGAGGAALGYFAMGPVGAMAGAVYGAAAGLAWGVGYAVGTAIYEAATT